MHTTLATRTLVVSAILAAALALSACGTPTVATGPQPAAVPKQAPADRSIARQYAGRPADRIAEDLDRRMKEGELPSPTCRRSVVVEHPDGGYHLACIASAPGK